MLNIPDLEALVLVACPEASLLDDPDLLLPIVTPFELECALHDVTNDDGEEEREPTRVWTGSRLWLDFHDILPGK